jgi:hypothetical protein
MIKRIAILLTAWMLGLTAPAMAQGPADPGALTPPEAFTPAEDPIYPVGTRVVLAADHLPGMEGAEAVVSAAFDTVLYAVSYTRTDTGEQVLWQRWVAHEEIEGAAGLPYEAGSIVTLKAGFAPGMEGAQAEIVEVLTGTAYMADFEASDGSGPVEGYRWLSEEEIHPYLGTVNNG